VVIADKELEVERQRVEVAKAELDAEIPASLLARREFAENKLKLERARTAHATAIDDLASTRKAVALEEEVKTIEYDKSVRNFERTEKQLDALVLTAPRSGVLVVSNHPWFGRKLQVSDMVQPGFSALRVSNLDAMMVEAQLSDVDVGRVEAGLKAECVLDAYPDRPFAGTVKEVSEIAREPNESSPRRFFAVTVALETTDTDVMRPGMSVRVDIPARVEADAVVVPREALVLGDSEDGARALLRGGGEATVEIGLCTARVCTVASGLEVGQPLRYAEDQP
jgi:multidrug resistance efflux pump